ncbi:PqqD family protein [Nonomuraea indica]|uniref:PqqD family protein n=1 Tax=Nonomuraea indica TaxID=1581193 RepID=A0ABW7ZX24_9ACTN
MTVRLRPLSLVDEGDEVLIGDPETGTFVALPAVGGVVITALQAGSTVEEAARRAEEYAGEPVDVPAFVEALRELGFVDEGERAPVATAPVQGRRWLFGIRPERAAPLFGRVAWTVYGLAALVNVGVLAFVPALRPDPGNDVFFADVGLSTVLLYPMFLAVAALHECWHWLAARALGVPARFGVDRRMVFVVFETDLSQLWSVPRRKRYGPLLAGLAVDSLLLAIVFSLRWVTDWAVLPALTYVLVFQIAWQCMIFLRTDLYGVLVVALGCKDLWRVQSLLRRRAFGRLGAEEEAELAAAHPQDLRVGRWFRWLWLAGVLVATAWVGLFVLPVLAGLLQWAAAELVAGPGAWRFWYAVGCLTVALAPWGAAAWLAVRARRLGRVALDASPA